MNVNVFNAIAALLEVDSSLTTQDKEKILAVCRHPAEFFKPTERKRPQLVSIQSVAKMLAVSRQTIFRMTLDGRLPMIRLRWNGSPRYDLDDIQRLIDDQKQKT